MQQRTIPHIARRRRRRRREDPAVDRACSHRYKNIRNPAERDHRYILRCQIELLQRHTQGEIARRADPGNADFLTFEIGAFSDAGVGYQCENHLMRRRADPDKVRSLGPSGHHRSGRQVAKLDFAGEQCLDRNRTAADIN